MVRCAQYSRTVLCQKPSRWLLVMKAAGQLLRMRISTEQPGYLFGMPTVQTLTCLKMKSGLQGAVERPRPSKDPDLRKTPT